MVKLNRGAVVWLFVWALLTAPFVIFQQTSQAAACVPPSIDYGQVTTSASLPAAGTYRVWTRMYVPDTTNNTYLLEIDATKCFNVGGAGVAVGTWVWVAFQNGSTTSRTDTALTQGTHTMKLIGNKPGVKIDRVVFTTDLNCVPTSFGDNCNVPDDTTPPTTQLTVPSDGATVSGAAVSLNANVSDANNVNRAEFYMDGVSLSTDTTSPYTATWDSTRVANGAHSLSARGYDASGNMSSSTISVAVKNGDTQVPSTPTGLTAEALSATKVHLKWSASSDNTGVTGYTVFRDGAPIAILSGTTIAYDDIHVNPSTSYSYTVDAIDQTGNHSARATAVTVTTPAIQVADRTLPSQPTNLVAVAASVSQIDLSWSASSDNLGVVSYDIYRSSGTTPQKIGTISSTSFGDTSLASNTTYAYYVVSRDAAGNVSSPSSTVSATTLTPTQTTYFRISGKATGSSGISLKGVRIRYTKDGVTHTTQTNRHGVYAFQDLVNGVYPLTAYKRGFKSFNVSVTVMDANITQNITLLKR